MQHGFMAVGGAVLFALGVAVGGGAQDEKKKPGAEAGMPPGMTEPAAEHKWLGKMAGKWKAKQSMKLDPAGDWGPSSEASETVRMDLGGIWQISDYDQPNGMMGAFKGHFVFGYDSGQKKFVGTWFDSMSPSPWNVTGSTSKDLKTMTLDVVGFDQQTKKESHMKEVVTFTDDKHRSTTMSMMVDGKEFEFMKIEYERAQ